MRNLFLLIWLMVPVLGAAYHLGPGQERMVLEDAASAIADAEKHVQAQQWESAVQCYDNALKLLPAEKIDETRRIRLERAKAKMFVKKLPEAHQELIALVDDARADPDADPELVTDARATLANAQYYLTWLMRLEGAPQDVWEPEIESARQSFRALAQQSKESGDEKSADRYREDLESTIRLARMDLSDLQGLPLPSQ